MLDTKTIEYHNIEVELDALANEVERLELNQELADMIRNAARKAESLK